MRLLFIIDHSHKIEVQYYTRLDDDYRRSNGRRRVRVHTHRRRRRRGLVSDGHHRYGVFTFAGSGGGWSTPIQVDGHASKSQPYVTIKWLHCDKCARRGWRGIGAIDFFQNCTYTSFTHVHNIYKIIPEFQIFLLFFEVYELRLLWLIGNVQKMFIRLTA